MWVLSIQLSRFDVFPFSLLSPLCKGNTISLTIAIVSKVDFLAARKKTSCPSDLALQSDWKPRLILIFRSHQILLQIGHTNLVLGSVKMIILMICKNWQFWYHWVGVTEQVLEGIEKALFLDKLWVDVVQLGHRHGRGLPHVRIFVLQALTQRLAQVLGDLKEVQISRLISDSR